MRCSRSVENPASSGLESVRDAAVAGDASTAHSRLAVSVCRAEVIKVVSLRKNMAISAPRQPVLSTPRQASAKVVAVQVHHLAPGGREVLHECILGVGTSINFRNCAQLGVRTEDK